jgi:hypothetical protein
VGIHWDDSINEIDITFHLISFAWVSPSA